MDNELKERAKLALERSMDPYNVSAAYDVLRYAKLGMYVTKEELKAAVEAEREACAEICDGVADDFWDSECGPAQCAEAIRARGET